MTNKTRKPRAVKRWDVEYDNHKWRINTANPNQYLSCRRIDGKIRILHRYVWEKFNGHIPPRHLILHKDGDPSNNNIDNLECISRDGTLLQNLYHPEKRGVSKQELLDMLDFADNNMSTDTSYYGDVVCSACGESLRFSFGDLSAHKEDCQYRLWKERVSEILKTT